MDKLLLAATYYKLFLINRDFHLIAGDSKRNTIEFDVIFREEHFRHLIGFDKLSDIAESKNKKYNLYENILNGKITYDYISKSENINEILPRLDYFLQIRDTLFSKKIFIGRLNERTFHRIPANYLFTKDINGEIVNLFLELIKDKLAVPISYFKTNILKYSGKIWTVLDRYELTNNNIRAYTFSELLKIKISISKFELEPNFLVDSYFVHDDNIYKVIESNMEDESLIIKVIDTNKNEFVINGFDTSNLNSIKK